MATLQDVAEAWCEAWDAGHEADRRNLLIDACAEDVTFTSRGNTPTDPSSSIDGLESLVQHIGKFLRRFPGGRDVRIIDMDVPKGMVRFSWQVLAQDQSTLDEGIEVGRTGADGRLKEIKAV